MKHRIRSFLARNWRVVLNIVTLLALGILVYAIHQEIIDTLRAIKHVQWWALLLIIPLQLWNYDSYARLYKTLFKKLGNKVHYKDMFRVSLELNFVNHVFPSGGVSGFSYFSLRMKDYGVRSSTATIVQLLRFFLGYLGFLVLLAVGILALAAAGRANNLVIMVATFLATLIVVGTFVLGYIIGDNGRINAASAFLARVANRIIALFRRGKPETISLAKLRSAMDEMHRSFMIIQENRGIVKKGVWYGFLTGFTELLTIYVVYIAFGEWVNIGAVILAYAIANFAGLVSVLPGGVGIYEALMTATLAVAGVPPALSIPVTVMYRVLGISVQIVPGWILYQMRLRDGAERANGQPTSS
jgi:putative heme transporter